MLVHYELYIFIICRPLDFKVIIEEIFLSKGLERALMYHPLLLIFTRYIR